MSTIVQPGMILPVGAGTAGPSTGGNSMDVQFAVTTPDFGGQSILLSLCITVTIGTVTIKVCYTKLATADGSVVLFNSMLPVNSVIETVTATFDVVEVLP